MGRLGVRVLQKREWQVQSPRGWRRLEGSELSKRRLKKEAG
jgi:hypothetical protein